MDQVRWIGGEGFEMFQPCFLAVAMMDRRRAEMRSCRAALPKAFSRRRGGGACRPSMALSTYCAALTRLSIRRTYREHFEREDNSGISCGA